MNAEQAGRAGKVLVTGAGGFLGTNIVWSLREQGFAVRALVRRWPRGPQWLGIDGVEWVIGDIRDAKQLQRAMANVSYVIHAAALTRILPRPRRQSYEVNVEGTRNVCALALQAGVRRLVFTSSAATLQPGTVQQPADENAPANKEPIRAPYYDSKRKAEQVVGAFAAMGLETIILCPGYVLGPRDIRPTTNEILRYAARWPWPAFPPGGMNTIDVREAALAHVRALWLGTPAQRYLLAGPYHSYVELGRMVRRLMGWGSAWQLPPWTRFVGSIPLAVASGVFAAIPNGLTVASFQYGYVAYHLSGARADHTFGLTHRPAEQTVRDTLQWFGIVTR